MLAAPFGAVLLGGRDEGDQLEPKVLASPFVKWVVRWSPIIGLAASLVGVILLFRFGMPWKLPYLGGDYILADPTDPAEVTRDALYKLCGWVGLFLIIVGTVLQAIGAWPKR